MTDYTAIATLDEGGQWSQKREVIDRLESAYNLLETVGEEAFDREFDYEVRLGDRGKGIGVCTYTSFDSAFDSWTACTGRFGVPTYGLREMYVGMSDRDDEVQIRYSTGMGFIEAEILTMRSWNGICSVLRTRALSRMVLGGGRSDGQDY